MATYTQVGEEVVCDLVDGTSATHLDDTNAKIGWGTDDGTLLAEAKSNTALGAEVIDGGARASVVTSQPVADKIQWVGTLTADAVKTIKEAGLFDGDTPGKNLIIRGILATAVSLQAGDKIQFTFTLEQT